MTGPRPVLQNGMGSPQGIWEAGSDQHHAIGTRASLNDGRVFYYARNSGAAIVAGNLLSSEAVSAQNEDIATNTAAIGDTSVTVTSGSATYGANDFAGGYLVVIDDTGEGITYKIAGHPAIAATTSVAITLVDPIYVAFGANTTACLVKNPWMDLVIAPTGQSHMSAGVSQVAVDAGTATKQYFWCQTWGVSAAWQDEASGIGVLLTSGATAGQVEAQDAVAEHIVGVNLFTGTAGENQPVFLTIAP